MKRYGAVSVGGDHQSRQIGGRGDIDRPRSLVGVVKYECPADPHNPQHIADWVEGLIEDQDCTACR